MSLTTSYIIEGNPTISDTQCLIRQMLDTKLDLASSLCALALPKKETFQFVCCCPFASTTNSSLTANRDFWLLAKFFSSGPSFVAYSGSANDPRSDSMSGKMKVVTASQSMKVALSPKAARATALSASVLKCYFTVSCKFLQRDWLLPL